MLSQIGIILFALLLYLLCAVLLVLEIFIPSLGLLTVFALAALAWGVYLFFSLGTAAGWFGVGAAFFLVPAFWVLTYKLFPLTRLGKTMILQKVDRGIGDAIPDRDDLRELVGRQGVVVGPLRPVGICDFDGRRVACLSESGFISRDTPVEVIRVEGNKVTVQEVNVQKQES